MKLWHIASLDKAEALKIQNENKLPPIIATLLQIRGIRTQEEVQDFLYNVSDIADPLEIRDMEKAAERVRRAIEEGEKICVYGDYDADGVTSTALLYSYLEAVGAEPRSLTPIPSASTRSSPITTPRSATCPKRWRWWTCTAATVRAASRTSPA